MKTMQLERFNKVVNTDKDFLAEGIVAFEQITFKINFYGTVVETTHDTKIMEDGRQFVIGGCGFIPEGFEVVNN